MVVFLCCQFAGEAPDRAKRTVKKKTGWFSSWFGSSDEDDVTVEVDKPKSKHQYLYVAFITLKTTFFP